MIKKIRLGFVVLISIFMVFNFSSCFEPLNEVPNNSLVEDDKVDNNEDPQENPDDNEDPQENPAVTNRSKVHEYESVGEDDLPTFEVEGYISGITEESDPEFLIQNNFNQYLNCLMLTYGSIVDAFDSFDYDTQTMTSSKAINSEVLFQVTDDNITITNNDDDSEIINLDIDWFDIYVKGSSPSSVVDFIQEGPFSVPCEFDLVFSTEFSETVCGVNDAVSSVFAELEMVNENEEESVPYLNGELGVSFASRYLDDETSCYYNLSGELLVDKFTELTETKTDEIMALFNPNDPDGGRTAPLPDYDEISSGIEEIIWGDSDNHISLKLTIGDNDGSLGNMTFYLSDLLPMIIDMIAQLQEKDNI